MFGRQTKERASLEQEIDSATQVAQQFHAWSASKTTFHAWSASKTTYFLDVRLLFGDSFLLAVKFRRSEKSIVFLLFPTVSLWFVSLSCMYCLKSASCDPLDGFQQSPINVRHSKYPQADSFLVTQECLPGVGKSSCSWYESMNFALAQTRCSSLWGVVELQIDNFHI